jgi:hypothetical protein
VSDIDDDKDDASGGSETTEDAVDAVVDAVDAVMLRVSSYVLAAYGPERMGALFSEALEELRYPEVTAEAAFLVAIKIVTDDYVRWLRAKEASDGKGMRETAGCECMRCLRDRNSARILRSLPPTDTRKTAKEEGALSAEAAALSEMLRALRPE